MDYIRQKALKSVKVILMSKPFNFWLNFDILLSDDSDFEEQLTSSTPKLQDVTKENSLEKDTLSSSLSGTVRMWSFTGRHSTNLVSLNVSPLNFVNLLS